MCLVLSGASPAAVLYVDANSGNPTRPYSDWNTAASTIQDAVDAASAGDQILVTNGVYSTGGRVVYGAMTNRVVVNKPVLVRSVNGAAVTTIQGNPVLGDSAVRCAYVATGASLVGFTLTDGATRTCCDFTNEADGGAVWCESTAATLLNCLVVSNQAYPLAAACFSGKLINCSIVSNAAAGADSSTLIGCTISSNAWVGTWCSSLINCGVCGNSWSGAAYSTLQNCRVVGNGPLPGAAGADHCSLTNCLLAFNRGDPDILGGASASVLVNCTVVSNLYGACGKCLLQNCIVYYNGSPNFADSNANYCCLMLPPRAGTGNFTNPPAFVEPTGDFHLLPNSPCINAGKNGFLSAATDLDGNPRVVGGTVDVGCYEYQAPTSIISYQWLQQYGLPTDGSADFADSDGDGMNNWKEWICGTDPTNGLSVLRMNTVVRGVGGVMVGWQSVSSRNYSLERSTNLASQPAFLPIAAGIAGQSGTTTYMDTNHPAGGAAFYRVGVQR
jgi:hypothetical protein